MVKLEQGVRRILIQANMFEIHHASNQWIALLAVENRRSFAHLVRQWTVGMLCGKVP
jgi:hypothetical protein